jgi:putative oxidoreductase
MLNRPLPAPARDIAILLGRIVLGTVLFAHGWQKLVLTGIAGTYGQFEQMGIPLAIVSASFVTAVELVGGVLIILGGLVTTVVALDLIVMIGAAVFVHFSHGIFAQDGGWELVGVIAACELALAAMGAGRFSLDHLIFRRRARWDAVIQRPQVPVHRAMTGTGTFAASVSQAPHRVPQHLGIAVTRSHG